MQVPWNPACRDTPAMRKTPPQTDLRRNWAQRLRTLRRAAGLSQEALAVALGISLKGYQRFEGGQHNPTLDTIGRIADALAIQPHELLEFPDAEPARESEDRGPVELAGARWRMSRKKHPNRLQIEVFDARVAAGPNPQPMPARLQAWAEPPNGRHPNPEGLFLLRIAGDSMAPRVHDGDWVLLRQPVSPPLLGKTVLVQLPDPADASIARWLLKRIAALEAPEAGGICVHLASTAPDVATIMLRAGDESEAQFVGELVEVVSVDAQ